MNNEYPEESELKLIKEWSHHDFKGLMAYIKYLWKYPQYWKEIPVPGYTKYEISTGGWSGNEDIIAAMMGNHLFWAVCWLSSRRGGYYEFQVKDNGNKQALKKKKFTYVHSKGCMGLSTDSECSCGVRQVEQVPTEDKDNESTITRRAHWRQVYG